MMNSLRLFFLANWPRKGAHMYPPLVVFHFRKLGKIFLAEPSFHLVTVRFQPRVVFKARGRLGGASLIGGRRSGGYLSSVSLRRGGRNKKRGDPPKSDKNSLNKRCKRGAPSRSILGVRVTPRAWPHLWRPHFYYIYASLSSGTVVRDV